MQSALGHLVLLGFIAGVGVYVFRSYATMTPSGTAAEDTKAFEARARRCASTVTVLTGRRRDVEGVAARSHSPRQSE
jgi:hypothetical protein